MSGTKEKRSARIIQDATGAPYTTCLSKLRSLASNDDRETYLDRVEAVPDEQIGTKASAARRWI